LTALGQRTGSEVCLGEILEHHHVQLGFCRQGFELGVLLIQLGQAHDFLGLHPSILLSPAVKSGLRYLDETADLADGPSLGDQLQGDLELADDLLRLVPGEFHDEDPAQSGRIRTLTNPGAISGFQVGADTLLPGYCGEEDSS
jgi:hypothetical protein